MPLVLSPALLSLCKTQKMLPQYIEYASTARGCGGNSSSRITGTVLFPGNQTANYSLIPLAFPQTLELYNVPNEQDGCSLQTEEFCKQHSVVSTEKVWNLVEEKQVFGGVKIQSQDCELLWAKRFCGWHSINIWRIT